MGFDNYPSNYTPDIKVGIDNLILCETTITDKNIISGFELIKIIQGNDNFYSGDLSYNNYYPKNYDKSIFKDVPTLEFNTLDNSLTSIHCSINDNYKDAIIAGLFKKYGSNRNREWKINGIYRTEINNDYGIMQIFLNERDKFQEITDYLGFKVQTTIKELNLSMNITKLKMKKLQMEKAREVENNRRKIQDDKKESENRLKSQINRLFNMD